MKSSSLRRVGKHDALDRRVADVALVPERDVLERRRRVAAHHAREPARRSRSATGCACAASPRSPSGPSPNSSSTSRTSVRARWRNSTANFSRLAPTSASASTKRGVAVALHDLRRDRLEADAEPRADGLLPRRDRGARRCRRRPRSCRPRLRRARASSRARWRAQLLVEDQQLEPEGGRLGVDAVGAADAGRVADARARGARSAAQRAIARRPAAGRPRRGSAARARCRARRSTSSRSGRSATLGPDVLGDAA